MYTTMLGPQSTKQLPRSSQKLIPLHKSLKIELDCLTQDSQPKQHILELMKRAERPLPEDP